MEGKPAKIFPCKQENLAFVRRIRVLFSEEPKLFMGWPWSSSHSSQAVERLRTAHTSIPWRGRCSYPAFSAMGWILLLPIHPQPQSITTKSWHCQEPAQQPPAPQNTFQPKVTINDRSELPLVKKRLWKRSMKQKLPQKRRFLFCFVKVEKEAWLAQSFMHSSSHKGRIKEQHGQISA